MSTQKSDPANITPYQPSSDEERVLARILKEALEQFRYDPQYHPRQIPQAVDEAIIAYEAISSALNPVKVSSTGSQKRRP